MSLQSAIRRLRYAASPTDLLADATSGYVYPRILSVEITDAIRQYARSVMSTDHDHFPNVRAEKEAMIKLVTELIGFGGGGAGNGVAAGDGENGLLLKSVMGTQVKDTGNTVSGVATTTSIPCTSAANLTVGGIVGFVLNGGFHARQIRSKAGNTLTLDRALPSAPANGAVVYASAWYRHAVSDHQHLWFDVEGVDPTTPANSWRRYIRGALGDLVLKLDGGVSTMEWSFKGSDWLANDGVAQAAPTPPAGLPATGIVMNRSTKVWNGATALACTALGFTLGNDVQDRPSIASPTGRAGYFVRDAARTFELTVLHDDGGDDLMALANSGGALDLLVEGTAAGAGNSFVIAAPVCELSEAKRVSVNGLDAYTFTGRVLRADSIAAGYPDVVLAFL